MALQLRTQAQVLAFFKSWYATNRPDVLMQEGSVPEDFADVNSIEDGYLYTVLTFYGLSQNIPGCRQLIDPVNPDSVQFRTDLGTALGLTAAQVTSLISTAIDNLVANYPNIPPRKQATPGTLVERFFTTSNALANISLGTTIRSADLTAIQYQTQVAIVNQTVTFDVITGLFYIDVPSIASVPGTASRVPINRITQLQPPVAGFSSATNITPTSGGTDTETDSDLLDRLQLSFKALQIDTIGGLTEFTEEQTGVFDALVVDNKSPLMTRGVGNQVDIWMIGSNIQPQVDTIVWDNPTLGSTLRLSTQPVSAIQSVTVNSVLKVLGVDYTQNIDATSATFGSVMAISSITFLGGHIPSNGDTVVVNYTYDKLIQDIQAALAQPQNQVLNSDILFREGVEILVDINMTIVLLSGFVLSSVQAAVVANVEAFFSTLKLGQSAFIGDVTRVIEDTPGVERVQIPFQMYIHGNTPGFTDILTQGNQYVRVNNINFV